MKNIDRKRTIGLLALAFANSFLLSASAFADDVKDYGFPRAWKMNFKKTNADAVDGNIVFSTAGQAVSGNLVLTNGVKARAIGTFKQDKLNYTLEHPDGKLVFVGDYRNDKDQIDGTIKKDGKDYGQFSMVPVKPPGGDAKFPWEWHLRMEIGDGSTLKNSSYALYLVKEDENVRGFGRAIYEKKGQAPINLRGRFEGAVNGNVANLALVDGVMGTVRLVGNWNPVLKEYQGKVYGYKENAKFALGTQLSNAAILPTPAKANTGSSAGSTGGQSTTSSAASSSATKGGAASNPSGTSASKPGSGTAGGAAASQDASSGQGASGQSQVSTGSGSSASKPGAASNGSGTLPAAVPPSTSSTSTPVKPQEQAPPAVQAYTLSYAPAVQIRGNDLNPSLTLKRNGSVFEGSVDYKSAFQRNDATASGEGNSSGRGGGFGGAGGPGGSGAGAPGRGGSFGGSNRVMESAVNGSWDGKTVTLNFQNYNGEQVVLKGTYDAASGIIKGEASNSATFVLKPAK